jgi:hypothetical protein
MLRIERTVKMEVCRFFGGAAELGIATLGKRCVQAWVWAWEVKVWDRPGDVYTYANNWLLGFALLTGAI